MDNSFDNINKEALSSVIDNIIAGVCIFAVIDGNNLMPLFLNEGFYRMMGYTHKEMERMLKNLRRSIIPDDLPIFDQGISDVLKDDGSVEIEFRTVTGDGSMRWLQVRGNLYGKMDGYPIIAAVILDSTDRKSVEEELALQAERLNILSSSVKEHLIDYNTRTDVMNIRIDSSIYKKGEHVIKDFLQSGSQIGAHPDDEAFVSETLMAAIKTPLSDVLEFRSTIFEDDDEEYHWYRLNLTSVRGLDGYVSRVVGRIVNIDAEKQKELELQLKADVDSLTGLYNKGATQTLISKAVEKCSAEGILGAVIMLDLDHFKSINDTFGHAVGDKVIAEAGKILNDTFKGRDIVGRMGGDEFMVFMEDIKGVKDAEIIAGKLNKQLTKTYEDSVSSVTVTASIGIAMLDNECCDFQSLYEKADKGLYATKERGRNGYTISE